MCCTPTLRSLIVSTLPPRLFLSTGYRPLGSCSRAAGWSAATLCIGPKLPIRDVRYTVPFGGKADVAQPTDFGSGPSRKSNVASISSSWRSISARSRGPRSSFSRSSNRCFRATSFAMILKKGGCVRSSDDAPQCRSGARSPRQ